MLRIVIASLAFGCCAGAQAFTVEEQSCREGVQFIRNAALSRDYGIPASEFLARVDADLLWLKSLPPDSRWFAKDDQDAALLRAGVASVFSGKLTPEQHGEAFRKACDAAMVEAAG